MFPLTKGGARIKQLVDDLRFGPRMAVSLRCGSRVHRHACEQEEVQRLDGQRGFIVGEDYFCDEGWGGGDGEFSIERDGCHWRSKALFVVNMSTLALELENELRGLEPDVAFHFERAVREMLMLIKRQARPQDALEPKTSSFDDLVKEEEDLRDALQRRAVPFAGGDRLTREELHDRHALR